MSNRPSPKPSRREEAKGERRARIVNSARDILRDSGVEGLSVKAVAARAGVSLSTIYSLFTSLNEILASVHDQDFRHFASLFTGARSADALARFFDAIDIAAERYREDPGFYRAIMRRDTGATPDAARDTWLKQPRAFWLNLIVGAVEEGFLRPNVDPATLNLTLNQILSGATADWVMHRISETRFAGEAKFACACLLAAFARGKARQRLEQIITREHDLLRASPRAGTPPAAD